MNTQNENTNSELHKVLIIGAGAAGMALADALNKKGISPIVIDEADHIGSSWRRRHDQLRLNTHRRYSGQLHKPLPKSFNDYPSKDDYISFLTEQAAELGSIIRLGVKAQRITANGSQWHVSTSDGILEAEHVVIATGSDRVATLPHWSGLGSYQGELIHAADFGDAKAFAGKKVLLVGIGNSAVDVGNHLSNVGIEQSWVSVRTGSHIIPKYIFGVPAHLLLVAALKWLPISLQDALIVGISRLILGNLNKYGLPRAPKGPVSRAIEDDIIVAVDAGFVKAIKKGLFKVVDVIDHFSDSAVHLVDGTTLKPDVIICATGYRLGLETLLEDLDMLDKKGKPKYIADQANPAHPGLWLFGLNSSIYGNMYTRLSETKRLADRIANGQNKSAK